MIKKYYAIQKANNHADIHIFGDITSFPLDKSDVSAYDVVQEIKLLNVDTIDVYINSYGGEVAEGWAIYNALKQHPARVSTYGVGFVASAALFPFMAGSERFASTTSAYYFHNVIFGISGYANDLRKAADEADKLTEIGINAFTQNTSLTEDELKALMDAETWLSPQEAFEKGIATALVNEKQATVATQSVRAAVINKLLKPGVKDKDAIKKQPAEKTESNIMQMLAGLEF